MSDRIEEIKARCEAALSCEYGAAGAMQIHHDSVKDIPFLCDEIDRLKMMLDAAAAGQETIQRKMADRNENLRLDYLDAAAERDAAVDDLKLHGDCDTCGNNNTLDCDIDAETGVCNFEWRGVQK